MQNPLESRAESSLLLYRSWGVSREYQYSCKLPALKIKENWTSFWVRVGLRNREFVIMFSSVRSWEEVCLRLWIETTKPPTCTGFQKNTEVVGWYTWGVENEYQPPLLGYDVGGTLFSTHFWLVSYRRKSITKNGWKKVYPQQPRCLFLKSSRGAGIRFPRLRGTTQQPREICDFDLKT